MILTNLKLTALNFPIKCQGSTFVILGAHLFPIGHSLQTSLNEGAYEAAAKS